MYLELHQFFENLNWEEKKFQIRTPNNKQEDFIKFYWEITDSYYQTEMCKMI